MTSVSISRAFSDGHAGEVRGAVIDPSLQGTRCLVTGAGGFLGRTICSHLLAAGAHVSAFGRSPHYADKHDKDVDWSVGDLADTDAVAAAVKNKDVVVHLIGTANPRQSNVDPLNECVTNVVPTLRLMDLCKAAGVRKFVFSSSGGAVYGSPSQLPISETNCTEPISAHGVSKLTIEKHLALYNHLYGMDYHVLRMANPYGRFQSPFRQQGIVAVIVYRVLRGEPIEIWGTGDVTRDFIHVDDVASAFVHAVAYVGPQKVMNVGAGEGRSVNQIAMEIPGILGLGTSPLVYKGSRSADVPCNILDISMIKRETSWSPRVSWPTGLRSTADWIASTLPLAG